MLSSSFLRYIVFFFKAKFPGSLSLEFNIASELEVGHAGLLTGNFESYGLMYILYNIIIFLYVRG